MLFKSILIADLQKKTAFQAQLSKGINIITSDDNHVGKSSLIKSLFHALGAECKFDEPWNLPTKLFVAWVVLNGHEYIFARAKDRFCILDEGEILLATRQVGKQLAPFLEQLLSFHISSLDKTTRMHRSDPMLLYLPYYIDQDLGWGNEPFVSFANVNQFKKGDRLSSLYSHLGIDEGEYSDLEDEKATIDRELKEISAEQKSMKRLLSLLNDELTHYAFDGEEPAELKTNLDTLFDEIDPLMEKANEYRIEIQNSQRALAHYNRELKVVNEYVKIRANHTANGTTGLNITCPNCGYEYGESVADSIRETYGIQGQEYVQQQIQYLISKTQEQIEFLKAKRSEVIRQIEEEKAKAAGEDNATEDYVRSLGLKKTICDIEEKYDAKLLEEHEGNERKKTIDRELRKRSKLRKELDAAYSDNLQTAMTDLGIWSPDFENKIGIMKPATIQGSAGSKAVLADYLSFITTRSEVDNPGPDIPFVVDSPRTKEASDLSSKLILESIKSIRDLLPQIIVATTEFNRLNEDLGWEDINLIFLDREKNLLIEDVYQEHQGIIEAMDSILKVAE